MLSSAAFRWQCPPLGQQLPLRSKIGASHLVSRALGVGEQVSLARRQPGAPAFAQLADRGLA
eukprot:5686529-Pyramimonas_sp.AAC.1